MEDKFIERYWSEPVTIGADNQIRGLGLVWYDGTDATRNEFEPGKFEALAPGAEIVKYRDDVLCCFNHDRNQVLGRESNSTLMLSTDHRGVRYSVQPNDEDPHHNSIRQKVKRRDVPGSSAHFKPLSSRWSNDGTLLFDKILLMEIGPVTSPAMTGTVAYSSGSAIASLHYETQQRLADFRKWEKGQAGEGPGAAVRREIDRLMNSGWTLSEIGARVDRSASTLGAIRSGDIANPPRELLDALMEMKAKPA